MENGDPIGLERWEAVEESTEFEGEQSGKIYCANCIHCKLVPSPANGPNQFYLRVRCDEGKWRKKLGEEKTYKYFTVARRSIPHCSSYEDMGESREFIRDLKKSLPMKDEPYRF
jgi:hypothetical protein